FSTTFTLSTHTLIPSSLFFSSHFSRDHPHLHSFPTRRSSDLSTRLRRKPGVSTHPSSAATQHAPSRRSCWLRSRRWRRRAIRSRDRKSTRLNSSHLGISYAVFCLKKKNKK